MAQNNDLIQDPKRAAALGELQKAFEKQYDLTRGPERMALVEALAEFGKHAAQTCSQANISITVGSNGMTGLTLATTPTPATPAPTA